MNPLFEIPEWETLRIAGIGRTRTGKTTFFASNAIPPIYAIDADKGFVRTRKAMVSRFSEVTGKIYHPTNKGCLVPLFIHQEAEKNIFENKIKTTVIDSVTKIYGFNTRPAVMAGRMSPDERVKYGFSRNVAANLRDKADAIQVLTYLAGYGTHIFYIWHEQQTVDMASTGSGKVELVMRETMSPEERKRLLTSIDIVLRFHVDKGRYAVTVDPETRGYGVKPNTGFTIYDKPGNFWRGALERLYGLIYTTFESKEEAIAWGQNKLDLKDNLNTSDWYEEVKSRTEPKNHNDMWIAWMLAVEEEFNFRGANGQEKGEVKKPAVQEPERVIEQEPDATEVVVAPTEPQDPAPPPMEYEQGPDNMDGYNVAEDAHALGVPGDEVEAIIKDELTPGEADLVQTTAEDLGSANGDEIVDEALGRLFTNGDEVADENYEDFREYRRRFGREPYDIKVLTRAKEINKDWLVESIGDENE